MRNRIGYLQLTLPPPHRQDLARATLRRPRALNAVSGAPLLVLRRCPPRDARSVSRHDTHEADELTR